MKIGSLKFKSFAVKKPLMITPEGRFVTVQQVVESPRLGMGSLFTLSEELQVKLAIERYSLEPDFTLGIVGQGMYTRDEVIQNIRTGTEFGKLATRAEMGYCSEFVARLGEGKLPAWPKIPPQPARIPPWWQPVQKCVRLRVNNRALFCENTTDGVTAPIAAWRVANVHTAFANRGFTVVALTGADDTRANFVPAAKHGLTTYISGVGHGNYNLYTGNWGDHILEIGVYDPAEVKGKCLHFLSCRTGRDLGPDTIAKGAKAYAGYDENFTFVWDDSATPVNEFLLFVQSDATFDLQMAAGATAGNAFQATKQAFNAAAAQVPNTAAATWLTYNRDHLRLHGAAEATIVPFRWVKICFPIKRLEMESALLQAGELED